MTSILPKGFKNLPVSAGLVTALLVVPLAVSLFDLKPYFVYAYAPFISEWHQYWRLLVLQAQFQNQSEVLLSIVLVALKLKNLERVYGSDRFVKHLILLGVYNMLGIALVSFVGYMGFRYNLFVPAGPYGVLFGLIYCHHLNTPASYLVELNFSNVLSLQPFGREVSIVLNDKFDMHVLSLMLTFNQGLVSSPVVAAMGYVIGYLYFNELLPVTDTSIGVQLISVGVADTVPEAPEEDPSQPPRTLFQQVLSPN